MAPASSAGGCLRRSPAPLAAGLFSAALDRLAGGHLGIGVHQGQSDLLLLGQDVLGDLRLIPEAGIQRSDLHGNVLADLGDVHVGSQIHQHADLAAGMDITHAGVVGEADEAADLQVLTDGHDLLGHGLGDAQIAVQVLAVHQSIHIGGILLGDDLGDVLHKGHEQVALGAEVGLAVDLHHDAHAILGECIGHALGGDTAGLLGSLGQTLLAQPLNSLIHIAIALDERLLAVHHAHAGHFAQGLYISGSKSHFYILL